MAVDIGLLQLRQTALCHPLWLSFTCNNTAIVVLLHFGTSHVSVHKDMLENKRISLVLATTIRIYVGHLDHKIVLSILNAFYC